MGKFWYGIVVNKQLIHWLTHALLQPPIKSCSVLFSSSSYFFCFCSFSLHIWLFHMFGSEARERTVQHTDTGTIEKYTQTQTQVNERIHQHNRHWNVFHVYMHRHTRLLFTSRYLFVCALCVLFALFLTIIIHRHRRNSSCTCNLDSMQAAAAAAAEPGSAIDLATVLLSVSSWSWVSWEHSALRVLCWFYIYY